jgi:ArsR family transcriptional regulator
MSFPLTNSCQRCPEEDILLSTKVAVASRSARRKPASAPGKGLARISDESLDELEKVFRVLADKSRLKILLALAQQGEMHVTSLCELLGTPAKPASQPAVSHHLTLLRYHRLVNYRRDGKNNFYRVEPTHLCEVLEQFFAESGNGQKLFQFPGFSLAYRGK